MSEMCRICLSESRQDVTYCTINNSEIRRCSCSFAHAYTISSDSQSVSYIDGVYAVVSKMPKPVSWLVQVEQRINFTNLPSSVKKKVKRERSGRVLDFGCGNGHFLGHLSRRFFVDGIGVGDSLQAESATKTYGLKVLTEQYKGGEIQAGNYDLIFLNHVLEHIDDPLALLKELSLANLASEGMVVIEVPNFNSWQRKIFRSQWMHLDTPYHLHHFTQNSLTAMCELAGLKVHQHNKKSFLHAIYGVLSGFLSKLGFQGRLIELMKTRSSITYFISAIVLSPVALLLALTIFNDAVLRVACVKQNSN